MAELLRGIFGESLKKLGFSVQKLPVFVLMSRPEALFGKQLGVSATCAARLSQVLSSGICDRKERSR